MFMFQALNFLKDYDICSFDRNLLNSSIKLLGYCVSAYFWCEVAMFYICFCFGRCGVQPDSRYAFF